jgi:PAS domain S-box-containing protein
MVCRWRPDGTIYYCNAAYARQCGLPREQVIGASLHDLTPGSELLQILSNVRRLRPDHPVSTYDHRIPEPKGEGRWQEWIDLALLDGQGRIVGYQSTGRDITRRKRAEARLRRNEQRLRLALSAARQRIWELDLRTGKARIFPVAGGSPAHRAAPARARRPRALDRAARAGDRPQCGRSGAAHDRRRRRDHRSQADRVPSREPGARGSPHPPAHLPCLGRDP